VLRDRDLDAGGDLGKTGSGLDDRHYAQQDANYNVTALTNSSGTVVERYLYDPYGSFTVHNDDATWTAKAGGTAYAWKHLHQGGAYDDKSGLYHFRHRDYDPALGRWTRQDPLGYRDGSNLYQVGTSSPVTKVDPMGLMSESTSSEEEMSRPSPGPQDPRYETFYVSEPGGWAHYDFEVEYNCDAIEIKDYYRAGPIFEFLWSISIENAYLKNAKKVVESGPHAPDYLDMDLKDCGDKVCFVHWEVTIRYRQQVTFGVAASVGDIEGGIGLTVNQSFEESRKTESLHCPCPQSEEGA